MFNPSELQRLEELHAARKNDLSQNLRYASQAQMDFYYAAHKLVPALLAVVRAAQRMEHLLTYDQDPRNYNAEWLAEIQAFSAALAALEEADE